MADKRLARTREAYKEPEIPDPFMQPLDDWFIDHYMLDELIKKPKEKEKNANNHMP